MDSIYRRNSSPRELTTSKRDRGRGDRSAEKPCKAVFSELAVIRHSSRNQRMRNLHEHSARRR
jgi:hypothetical protein